MKSKTAAIALAGIVVLGVSFINNAEAAGPKRAEAIIHACRNGEKITGKATLVEQVTPEGVKQVTIVMAVQGLKDGRHAVHIHEKGVCTPCGTAGGHFDPGPNSNSNPDGNHPFHMGDLINIDSENGQALMETTTNRVTLSPGPLSVLDSNGSAFIIHDNLDTYCPDGVVKGCAGGSRAACGIIKPVN